MQENQVVVNLASQEYAEAVNWDKVERQNGFINIEFRQERDGKIKNLGILTKKARGKFLNFAISNQIRDMEELKDFQVDGYVYEKTEGNNWFFVQKES